MGFSKIGMGIASGYAARKECWLLSFFTLLAGYDCKFLGIL
jgi:hypothetical protein